MMELRFDLQFFATAGKAGGFYLGANKVAEVIDCNLQVNGSTIDFTNFDSGEWEEFINGTKNWSLTVNANFKATDTNGQKALMDNINLASQTPIAAELRLTAAATPKFTGNVVTESYSVSVPVKDKITISFNLKGSGALSYTAS
jgi:predicted secreted protein